MLLTMFDRRVVVFLDDRFDSMYYPVLIIDINTILGFLRNADWSRQGVKYQRVFECQSDILVATYVTRASSAVLFNLLDRKVPTFHVEGFELSAPFRLLEIIFRNKFSMARVDWISSPWIRLQ